MYIAHPAILVLALGGEAVSSGNTGLDILFVVSIVGGYVGLAALWYFVFRDKASRNTKRKKGPAEKP